TACRIFGKPIGTFTKDSPERNVGKTCDLAFGYAGGVNAFRKFSDQFTDEEVKVFNRDWRAAHPNIKRYWHRLDKAAWIAVQQRGRVVRAVSLLSNVMAHFCSFSCQAAASSHIRNRASLVTNTNSLSCSQTMLPASSVIADTAMVPMAGFGLKT